MEVSNSEKACPKCGNLKVKNWKDLDDEQRFVIERLPGSAEYTPDERKKHRYCMRCWYEESGEIGRTA